jgi:hypothetical protein
MGCHSAAKGKMGQREGSRRDPIEFPDDSKGFKRVPIPREGGGKGGKGAGAMCRMKVWIDN